MILRRLEKLPNLHLNHNSEEGKKKWQHRAVRVTSHIARVEIQGGRCLWRTTSTEYEYNNNNNITVEKPTGICMKSRREYP